MKRITVLIFLYFFAFTLNGQDTTYVKDYSHKIHLKTGGDLTSFSYKITNTQDDTFLQFQPNATPRLTASVLYRFLGVTLGYSPGFSADKLKGDSDIRTLRLRLFIKRFVQNFKYSNMKGFYLANTGDYINNWEKGVDPYIIDDDFSVNRLSGKTTFVVNKKFSYKALVVQSQKQLKSAGSFIPNISYAYTEFSNRGSGALGIQDETNFDVNFNGGYIHNFVFGKHHNFYTSLHLTPGIGVKFSKTTNRKKRQVTNTRYSSFSFEGGTDLGYNSKKIFGGLKFNVVGTSYSKNEDTSIEDSNVYFQLFFGYRFNAPQPVVTLFDHFNKKNTNSLIKNE